MLGNTLREQGNAGSLSYRTKGLTVNGQSIIFYPRAIDWACIGVKIL